VIIAAIERAFNIDVTQDDYSTWTDGEIKNLAKPKLDEAYALTVRSLGPESAVRAANLYGECYAIAKSADFWRLEKDARSRFAQVVSWVTVPNRDESRSRASELFYELGADCLRRADNKSAAIALTNGALSILEMNNATKEQILNAKRVCADTIRMRSKGSVDFAYSQMNLALAERQCVSFTSEPDRALLYSNILRSLDRAMKVFKANSESSVPYKKMYYQNVMETLIDWIAYETDKSTAGLYEECVPPDIDPVERWGLTRFECTSMLKSNPAVLGFDAAPEWVPDLAVIEKEALGRIPTYEQRLKKADLFVANSSKVNSSLKVRIFQLRSMLVPLHDVPEPPFDALDHIWGKGEVESYFINASSIISWENAGETVPQERYLILLNRVLDCILAFRRSWSYSDIQRLLARNPLTFRLAACELARFGRWRESYLMLESSRGLASSRTLDSDPMRYDQVREDISWVHITHNPKATYVVIRIGESYSGMEFPSLSGKELTARFVNIEREGLLSSRKFERKNAARSASEVESMLRPAADWIDRNTGDRVVLLPGGYYQAFPVWACGALGDALLSGRKIITSAPSRTIAIHNDRRASTRSSVPGLAVQDASSVPGYADLSWSSVESTAIQTIFENCYPVTSDDATKDSLLGALELSEIVHFTGHSEAAIDPIDSAIVTYSNPVTVHEILGHELKSSIALIGSCESGLARNFSRQDEMLSIQTAMYYAGVQSVIGTAWPIMDPAGFTFTVIFYRTLRSLGIDPGSSRMSASSASRAYSAALAWMRDATIADVQGLAASHGIAMNAGEVAGRAFDFFDWAAFGMVGVKLPERADEDQA
jgi:hypothetical protein